MNSEGIWDRSPVYFAWFGKPVLPFVVRECRVPIPCNIIAESVFSVRIRLQPEWEINVPKESILVIEEASASRETCLNQLEGFFCVRVHQRRKAVS
jgi:hypothetical protein